MGAAGVALRGLVDRHRLPNLVYVGDVHDLSAHLRRLQGVNSTAPPAGAAATIRATGDLLAAGTVSATAWCLHSRVTGADTDSPFFLSFSVLACTLAAVVASGLFWIVVIDRRPPAQSVFRPASVGLLGAAGTPPVGVAVACLAAVVCYVVALDGALETHWILVYAPKRASAGSFWAWTIAALVAAAASFRRVGGAGARPRDAASLDRAGSCSTTAKPLAREQTEEWKGAMQCVFVLYHYFEYRPVYNAVRVLVASYVWLCGFGNFRSLQARPDFSVRKVARTLVRLNLLCAITCASTGVPYMVYYICPLISFNYLGVFVTMAVCPWANRSARGLGVKLALLLAAEVALFEFDDGTVFDGLFGWLPQMRLHGSLHEWRFRAGLDRYMAWLGMATAAAFPALTRCLEWMDRARGGTQPIAGWGATALVAALSVGGLAHLAARAGMDKFEYNSSHPYTAALPLLGYVTLRNLFPWARERYSSATRWIGARTLETYILQSSVLMAADAKQVILPLPALGSNANFAVMLALYLGLSSAAFTFTNWATTVAVPVAPPPRKVAT